MVIATHDPGVITTLSCNTSQSYKIINKRNPNLLIVCDPFCTKTLSNIDNLRHQISHAVPGMGRSGNNWDPIFGIIRLGEFPEKLDVVFFGRHLVENGLEAAVELVASAAFLFFHGITHVLGKLQEFLSRKNGGYH